MDHLMDGAITLGTVIATFTKTNDKNGSLEFDPSGNSHVAIYKGPQSNGFDVWDQNWDGHNEPNWDGHNALGSQGVFGTHIITTSGSGNYHANQYYVVQIKDPGQNNSKVTSISSAPAGADTTLQYGQQVTGSIALANDYQDWKFTGQAGDIINVDMIQDGSSSLSPVLQLRDPSGVSISNSGGSKEARIANFALLFSGIYIIRASGYYNYSHTMGGYKLSLALKPPPVTLIYGQEVIGNIAFNGDYQEWKFIGNAGDIINIHISEDGGASLSPVIMLIDPTEKTLSTEGDTSDARIKNFALLFSGTYTIRAHGYYNYSYTIGGFKLSLALKPPIVTLNYGQEVNGSIAFADDYQDWKFTGNAGDIINIHISEEGGASLSPVIMLVDPTGKTLSSAGGNTEARIANFALLFPGTYTIRAYGYYNYSYTIGSYQLSLALKPPPVALVYSQEVQGNITFNGDYQDWKFTGNAGDIITISIFENGGASLSPVVMLIDTAGKTLSSAGGNTEAHIANYKLGFSGTYTIRADGYYNYSYTIGGYRLQLTKN